MQGKKVVATAFITLLAFTGITQNLELVENKGQWNKAVKFQAKLLTGAFYLESAGYKVLQHHPVDLQNVTSWFHGSHVEASPVPEVITLRSHAYEVLFDHCNPDPVIIPEQLRPGYNNYFTSSNPKEWASECKIYGGTIYKNMYPGIDVHYYSQDGQMKYDIIIHPNADISKLALTYNGVEALELKEGELFVKTSVGEIKENRPFSYQLKNGVHTEVPCHFQVSGKTARFQLGSYDRSKTLIIDPTLVFSSFTGSTADNWGYVATYGPGGTSFGAGIVFGLGFPVSTGAFQTTFGGGTNTGEDAIGFDMGIIKLSSDGSQRIYATYVGGAGNESPQSLIADAQGNLVVAGRTTSGNFPVTRPLIGTGGGWDIFVLKLNPTGTGLVGSIRIGGISDDGVNIRNKYPNPQPSSLMQNYNDDSRCEAMFDQAGNILLASCTQSGDFPVTAGTAFQPAKSGLQDALFLKFDSNLSNELYGSFLGGSGDDVAYVLSISPETGNTWIAGGTRSTNFPGNKTGTVGQNPGGNIDGFVAVVSPSGTLLKSTYIATAANEQVYGLKLDKLGFPYILATTTGNLPVQNAAFSQAGGKQFIGKLQKDLSGYLYSTVFGTNAAAPNISPTAFFVDNCENVYVSGWGGSITQASIPQFPNAGTMGMTITPNALQSTTDGKDFYLFVLEKNAISQLYGSFFGENGGATDHVDGAASRFDEDGVLHQAFCANCGGTVSFPTTPGSWAPTNSSGAGCNEAIVKIRFDLSGIRGGIKSSINSQDGDTSSCGVPLTVDFRDTVAIAASYEWNFGDGSGPVVTASPTISHTYFTPGIYQARLIAVDNSKCISRDTSYVNITSSAAPYIGSDTTIYQNCPGDTTNLLLLYNTTGLTASWNTPTPSAVSPGNYQLTVTNNIGCSSSAVAAVVLEVAHWTGNESSDWHTAANWNINKIPTSKTHVIVDAAVTFPCIISNDNAEVASIQARNGAIVQAVNNRMIEVKGICVTLPLN
ncbi:MAG: PKD domain-containing protein [Bacteroidota bacterium]